MIYLTSDLNFNNDDEEKLFKFDSLPDECTILILGNLIGNITYDKLYSYIQRIKHVNMERRADRKLAIILSEKDKKENFIGYKTYDAYKNLGFDRVFEYPIIVNNILLCSETNKNNYIRCYDAETVSWDRVNNVGCSDLLDDFIIS